MAAVYHTRSSVASLSEVFPPSPPPPRYYAAMNPLDFRPRLPCLRLAFGAMLLLLIVAPLPAGAFTAGFAERDITPDIGSEMPGNYLKSFHRSFHDPCKVRAAVFQNGDKRVALVGVDALMIPRPLVLAARRKILEQCGLPPEAVLVGASHSHSSGPIGFVQPGEFDQASEFIQELAYQQSPGADPGYLRRVEAEIVRAVCLADRQRVEARIGFGSGREGTVSFNRRLRMKNGMTWSHPGRGNPGIIDYAGPIDPEVGVVGVWDKQDQLLGCIVNFACHATTNPGGISANWIYYLEQTIQGALQTHAPVVFLQGACGDITQVDNLSRYSPPSGEEQAKLVGGRVGAEAVKVLLGMVRSDDVHLDGKSKTWNIKRRAPSRERVEKCRAIVQGPEAKTRSTEWIFAKEILLLDAELAVHPQTEVEAQAVQVGPAVFISNPAELFVQFGLDLKKRSPFHFTWPVELANGCVGYVPTEEAFSPAGGGYETRLTSYSNLVPSAGRQMIEAGLDLAEQMQPDPVPAPPQASPFKTPWSYGDVPPELE